MPKNKATKNSPVTNDILPEDQIYWERIGQVVKDLASAYGFERLDLPVAEKDDLFVKRLKGYADVPEKEICVLENKAGERLRLRSDFIPSIARAYLENNLSNLPKPVRLHTTGPLFCNANDKKNWFNQFNRASFEIIGEKDSVIDAQLIQLFFSISKDIGLKNLITEINSIGCSHCRPGYRKLLIGFYRHREKIICAQCRQEMFYNPFHLLNCKKIKCVELMKEAPQMIDYLCNDCHDHLRSILEFLDEVEVPYILNPYLFRNSDYNTKTIFKVFAEDNQDRSIDLAAGCRHDDLIKALGGEATPAVGLDVKLDRIIEIMKENEIKINQKARPLIFLVQLGSLGKKRSFILFEQLRRAGLRVANSVSCNTIASQFKVASQLGARFVLILGQKEALDGTVIVRDIYSGAQELIPLAKVIKELKIKIKRD